MTQERNSDSGIIHQVGTSCFDIGTGAYRQLGFSMTDGDRMRTGVGTKENKNVLVLEQAYVDGGRQGVLQALGQLMESRGEMVNNREGLTRSGLTYDELDLARQRIEETGLPLSQIIAEIKAERLPSEV